MLWIILAAPVFLASRQFHQIETPFRRLFSQTHSSSLRSISNISPFRPWRSGHEPKIIRSRPTEARVGCKSLHIALETWPTIVLIAVGAVATVRLS
jgi:hypothetical protein